MSGEHQVCPMCCDDMCECVNAAELERLREIERAAREWKATRERMHVIGGSVATLASVEQELFKLLDKD